MFYIRKTFEVAGSHCLELDYDSKCEHVHGHNWIITVYCKNDHLDKNGMVIDFSIIKRIVHGHLDHENFNDVLEFNPTAENIAKWICGQVPYCYMVDVQESENNIATYSAGE